MTTLYLPLAVLCAGAAVLCFYLAAPHQQWLAQCWPGRPGRLAGALLAVASFGVSLFELHPATALFTLLTLLMAFGVALPFLGAWRHLRKAGAP